MRLGGLSTMRIGTWNILSGQPPLAGTPVDLAADVAALDLDVLGLNEVDVQWARSGFAHQAGVAAAAMDAADWRFAPSFRGTDPAREATRGVLLGPHDRVVGAHYGIALLSRIPVRTWHRLELGRARVGLPLLYAREGRRHWRYIPDEPHQAIAAQLHNGWTVIGTHLSFVTPIAVAQLMRLRTWARRFGPRTAIIGDMNLARFAIPLRPQWQSAVDASTYPAWRPVVQFDHILLPRSTHARTIALPRSGMSDHLPIAAEVA